MAERIRKPAAALGMGAFILLAGGCGQGGGPPARPPATVTVMHPLQEEVTDWEDFPGRLQSPESTNIQARDFRRDH